MRIIKIRALLNIGKTVEKISDLLIKIDKLNDEN